MNKNVKRMFFVLVLVTLLMSVSVVCATDDTNSTSTTDNSVSDTVISDNTDSTTLQNDNNLVTNTKNIKKETTTHIVNNETIKNVFSNTGKSEYANNNFDTNTLNDSINEGDILDFQGTITGDYNLTINKPVNIISSTNDALISLNSSCLNLIGSDPGNSFSVISTGSNSNITDINFFNTQLFVINATNVTLDHINATVNGNPVGGGIGQTSIRENSTNITVKNSYFYTKDNGGSSTFVLAYAQNCTIFNNTFDAEGNAGNLFYLTTFNVNVPSDVVANSNNRITNNTIGKPGQSFGGIKLACVLSGANNTLESNTIAGDISTQWGGATSSGYTIVNNNTIYGGIVNNLQSNWTISNNQILNETNIIYNATIVNNTFTQLTLNRGSCNIYNNTITDLNIISSENNIINNTIKGITNIQSSNNEFINNSVINSENYTINIQGNDNIITGNYLIAGTNAGDITITNTGNNEISNNTPITNTYDITEENYSNYFDENGYLFNSDIQNYDVIQLIGELNNKSFIINNRSNSITGIDCIINNGQIKTINNGHIGLENLKIINNEEINSSIIIDSDSNLIKNITINHNTNKDINEILTIGKDNKILYNNITITTQNKNPTTVNAITIQDNKNIINNNNITINGDENTNATAIYCPKKDMTNDIYINKNQINISSAKNAYAINILPTLENTNITSNAININSEEINAIKLNETKYFNITSNTINLKSKTATAININNYESARNNENNIRNNQINIEANNISAIKILSENMNVNTTGLYNNELNLIGNNTTAMKLMGKCQGSNNKISITSPTATAFYISNANYTSIRFDNRNPLVIKNGTAAIIENSYNTLVYGVINTTNAIKCKNTTNININFVKAMEINSEDKYAIILDSCENISLKYCYFISDNYKKFGNNAVNVINGNNITIENNSPETSYLTDETYNSLFDENDTYTGTTNIFIGPNINNKTLIFNTTINITGVNNPTITNSILKFTSNAINSNITQINTYDTQIIIESNITRLTYSNIVQNDNNMSPIININNSNRVYINNNNITGINTNNLQIKINNSESVYIQLSNITSTNQTTIPLITVDNSTGGISSNYMETIDLKGIKVVKENNSTIEYYGNLPLYMIKLTDENYNQYFDGNSNFIGDNNADGLILDSDIYNKNFTFNKKMIIDNPKNHTLYNTTISNSNKKITLTNLIINNTHYNKSTIIATDLNLSNNNIFQNGNNINVISLQNSLQEINIENNNITCEGNNNTILSYPSVNKKMIIKNNNIYQNGNNSHTIILENSTLTHEFEYNNITCEGNDSTILEFNNYKIEYMKNNNINAIGSNIIVLITKFNQNDDENQIIIDPVIDPIIINAIMPIVIIDPVIDPIIKPNINMSNNNISIYSNTPTTTIIIENGSGSITNNQIISNTTYGEIPIILASNSTNLSINDNYIESIDICGDDSINTDGIKQNNIPTNTGFKSIINITTTSINEKIASQIEIITTDNFGQNITGTITATVNGKQMKVTNNYITITPDNTDDITVQATYTDPTGKYNTITITKTLTVTPTTLTIDPITAKAGENINITARITADNETLTDINQGKVTFKVNGKTVKDANGKVIYAKVVNGIATIENYVVPDTWKEGSTIQAIYSGSSQCEKLTSEKTNITITKAVPTLTTEDINTTVGDTITLTATIIDNDKVINTGKIVFKINGKTVKDANGKVIYAKVVNNTVTVEYTLPEDMKAKDYTITATFISPDYDKLTDEKTLKITA